MTTRTVARTLAALALSTLSLPALASSANAEVCVLTVTQARTPPRKPELIVTLLDCGKRPTEQQKIAVALVNNAMNGADALEVAARFGYEIESGNVRESYTGHDTIGVFVLVKAEGESAAPAVEEEEGLEDVEAAPAAEPAAEAAPAPAP